MNLQIINTTSIKMGNTFIIHLDFYQMKLIQNMEFRVVSVNRVLQIDIPKQLTTTRDISTSMKIGDKHIYLTKNIVLKLFELNEKKSLI